MILDQNRITAIHLLESTIGVGLDVLENEYQQYDSEGGGISSFHQIVFQIKNPGPDTCSIGVLFALALMSFTYAAPKGYSFTDFIPDEEYSLGLFLEGLRFETDVLSHEADEAAGRYVMTHISFVSGGQVTVTTLNRDRAADAWLSHLQGTKPVHAA